MFHKLIHTIRKSKLTLLLKVKLDCYIYNNNKLKKSTRKSANQQRRKCSQDCQVHLVFLLYLFYFVKNIAENRCTGKLEYL